MSLPFLLRHKNGHRRLDRQERTELTSGWVAPETHRARAAMPQQKRVYFSLRSEGKDRTHALHGDSPLSQPRLAK